MGAIEDLMTEICVQTAVYWANPVRDGSGGYTYDAPIEVSCRWDIKQKLVLDRDGKEVVSQAKVFVTQDMDVEEILYFGGLTDLTAAQKANPKLIDDAFEIITFEKVSQIFETNDFYRAVYL